MKTENVIKKMLYNAVYVIYGIYHTPIYGGLLYFIVYIVKQSMAEVMT